MTKIDDVTSSLSCDPHPTVSVYLDVKLDVDHPNGLACVEAPDPDGGVLAAGDHQL